MGGLLAGFIEEIGWTGFPLPKLRAHHGIILSGIILGVIGGAWHGLTDYWGSSYAYGSLWFPRITLWIAALTAYRVVIAWVHDQTRSLLLAQLMQTGFVAGQPIMIPVTFPADFLVLYGTFTVALWGIVIVLACNQGTIRHKGRILRELGN